MNNLNVPSEPPFLQLPESLTTSPSQSTFMAEEDASICPLLPNTGSPPLDFTHPLTPSTGNDNNSDAPDDQAENDDTSSSSSGIGIGLGSNSAYHHLRKNGDIKNHENGNLKNHGKIDFDYLNSLNITLSKDMPSFVFWNWPLIRKFAFFIFLSGIFAMCAIVVGMIYNLPRICNPESPWYQGSVFYEIFPASFKDSDGNGIGDLRGLASEVSYFQELSIGAIHLNSIFPATHYPENFEEIKSLMEVAKELGTVKDLEYLVAVLHGKNISLILDLPLHPYYEKLDPPSLLNKSHDTNDFKVEEYRRIERDVIDDNAITNVMRFWLSKGVDGFYLRGLENFADDQYLMENVREWKFVLGKDRIMIVNQSLFKRVSNELAVELIQSFDLVDVFLDITNGTQTIEEQVNGLMKDTSLLKPSETGPWIHWSINGISSKRVSSGLSPNASLAGVLLEMMLPGTPSIFYGDEVSMGQSNDPLKEHEETKHLHHLPTMDWNDQHSKFTSRHTLPWLPKSSSFSYHHLEYVVDAITLRKKTPSLYKNAVSKDGNAALCNIHVRANKNDLLIIERIYPRRNTFVSVTNLGEENLSVDISKIYYSGELILGPAKGSKLFFSEFKIRSLETVIVRLDK